MVKHIILCVVCFTGMVAGKFKQRHFEIFHGAKVVYSEEHFEHMSMVECGLNCIENEQCELAGYDTNSRLCQISYEDSTIPDSLSNSVIIKVIDDCGALLSPQNGQVTISIAGEKADFSCSDGYTLAGMDTLHCIQGSWNGTSPTCIRDDCGALVSPENGLVAISGSGEVAEFSCSGGYTLNGTDTLHCIQGSWNGTSPSCVGNDCGALVSPENGHVAISSGGEVADFSCSGGYTLVGTDTLHCIQGSWNGTSPFCVGKDCGATLETDYSDVKASYFQGTLTGATAVVTCATGHRSQSGLTAWTFTCDGLDQQWKTLQAPDCTWELMFRGTSKNGFNVTDAFLFGDASDGVTDEEGCIDVYNASCNLNYRNTKVDMWEFLNIGEVSYELYNSTDKVLGVLFNAAGSTINSWFSSSYVIDHPWSYTNIQSTYWDLNGPTDIIYGRSFRMTAGYQMHGIVCADHYFTIVFMPPLYTCAYDDIAEFIYPQFTYSTLPGGSEYNTEPFSTAETMGIWVKYE